VRAYRYGGKRQPGLIDWRLPVVVENEHEIPASDVSKAQRNLEASERRDAPEGQDTEKRMLP